MDWNSWEMKKVNSSNELATAFDRMVLLSAERICSLGFLGTSGEEINQGASSVESSDIMRNIQYLVVHYFLYLWLGVLM